MVGAVLLVISGRNIMYSVTAFKPTPDTYLVFDSERVCPLCGNDKKRVVSRRMQFKLDCTTVICEACAFCFVSPPPMKDAYDRFYREAYSHYYSQIHRKEQTEPIVETEWEKDRFNRIEQYKKIDGASVLEIGPGNGRFLSLVTRRGGICSAIEPSREFRNSLAKNGISIVGDFLEDVNSSKRYTIICAFQVLEHFHNPRAAVDKIFDLLEDDGIVILDVPNIWKPFRNLDRYFLRYVHLSYFSPDSLTRLLMTSGLELLHLEAGQHENIYSPSPIFAIARKRNTDTVSTGTTSIDNWNVLIRHLQRYRVKYLIFDAPRIWISLLKRSLHRAVSRSIIGAGYHNAKKILKA
jgi:2-polyprenyl-3-methyl-5-hydroxy-6-metoxy-1,4-benzoquinol methylase